MVLLLVTVPPRLVVALLVLVFFALFSYVCTIGWPDDQPLKGWRLSVAHCLPFFSITIAYLMGFWVSVKGKENYQKALKDGVRIGVFNHVSYVDAFVLVGLMGCSGLSKASNKNLPLLGSCVKGLQNVYLPDHRQIIKNKNEDKAQQYREDSVAAKIAERAKDRRYPMLALAPEGTCGNGYCLLKFRTGAFVSGNPVLPILLKYDTSCVNPAWTNVNEPFHLLRVLCQFRNKVEVTFLEAYYPTEAEQSDASFYADNIRRLMAEEMGVGTVEESYNQVYALNKLGIKVSWDGKTIVAPPGVIDKDGFVDLASVLDKKTS